MAQCSFPFFGKPDTLKKLMKAILLPLKVFALQLKKFIDPLKPIHNSCEVGRSEIKQRDDKTCVEKDMYPD